MQLCVVGSDLQSSLRALLLLSTEPPPQISLLKMILLLCFKKWLLFCFTEKFTLFLKTVVHVKLKMSQGKWMGSNN